MPGNISAHFTSDRGRPFSVTWESAELAARIWTWNESHFPNVLTPVFAWIQSDLTSQIAPYDDAGVEPFAPMRGKLVVHGFQYVRQSPLDPDEMASFLPKAIALGSRHGGSNHVWDVFAQPRSEAAVGGLQTARLDTPIQELSRLYHSALHNTHIGGMVALAPVMGSLAAMLSGLFPGPEAALVQSELGQGSDSATMQSNRAIDEAAAMALAEPVVARILASGRGDALAALRSEPRARAFLERLDAFVERYRWRAHAWDITAPTLGEQPAMALALIQQAMAGRKDDAASREQVTRRRNDAIARVEGKLANDTEKVQRFRALVAQLDNYTAIREGRALWQLMAAGSLRLALLAKGDAMVRSSVITARDDVFFLLPAEIDPFFELGARQDLRATVLERRNEWSSWLGDRPPRLVSASAAALPSPAAAVRVDTIQGLPGARGRVTARARVIVDFDRADELAQGEVLVCAMTSPPWTPLFAVASAVVTDSGLALSHPAIAAREFGIPCVVGADGATAALKTGDLITVDGDAGTIVVLERA